MNTAIRIQPREIDVPKDDPFKNDLLERKESVEVLTRLINSFEGPCVLAVDAAWGNGKTTFINMWAGHLLRQEFPVVKFNAWETDFSGEPFVALSSELTAGLQKHKDNSLEEKINDTHRVAKEIARRAAPGLIRVATMGILDVAPLLKDEVAESLASYAEDRLAAYGETQKSIKTFKTTLSDMAEELSEKKKHPLIVMIDELDRCRPTYAVELLEVAKHLFSVNHVVFILAINRNQLGHSIKALYGSEFDAEDYLRRFFDIDFQLPEPERDAFINAALMAVGVPDYFQQAGSRDGWDYEDVLKFLRIFLGASDISLRRVAQTIHRLGLVLAPLYKNGRRWTAMTAVVAVIIRTVDTDLYHRFIQGEASDDQVIDAVFSRPETKDIRQEKKSVLFEAVVILACYEVSGSREDDINTPLMAKYKLLTQAIGTSATQEFPDAPWARDVVDHVEGLLERTTTAYRTGIGFMHSVRCLELLYSGLEDNSLDKT